MSDKSREEAIGYLKGKTIADIKHDTYLNWFTIESITFTDGSILNLSGNADEARVETIEKPDGDYLDIDNSDLG